MDMEPAQLRLILLFIGICLVIGIYLWDRYQQSKKRLKGLSRRERARVQHEVSNLPDPVAEELPGWKPKKDDFDILIDEDELFKTPELEPNPVERQMGSQTQPETMPRQSEPKTVPASEQAETAEEGKRHYYAQDLALRDDLPQLVLQIGIAAKAGYFSGSEIEAAMRQVGMQPGAMNIYHRYDAHHPQRALFSIANMVKPGHFPLKNMAEFETPGLLLFAQLPSVRDGMSIYDEMLDTARQLAEILGGNLQDETHSHLTQQAIQHTRDKILEHCRQLRLAGVIQ